MSDPNFKPAPSKALRSDADTEKLDLPLDVTTDATGTPTLIPQRKVIAGFVTSTLLVVVVAAIGAITPDLFSWLGPWAPVAYAGVVALGGTLASYIAKPSARAF